MVLGASPNEIALVAFLLIVVLLATKIGRIGEAIGALFERDATADGRARQDSAESQEERPDR
ncbi:uncharacterized protein SOCEGT47_078080 [Sorangium cellulosum]|jgi:hypothetical protein|uniref:Uncharacterized protein n=1 Tax=Sorangium cellulosum TaxID=56 RepID=A0A4P2QC04_SORCE|nr:hypothetical protein [Sorangium cellulosum]AUX27225.1 uncharacterized protein SOCEGT47_078080 [Sorangium cellulosum]